MELPGIGFGEQGVYLGVIEYTASVDLTMFSQCE
jgi:hypothetical protein